MNNTPTEFKDFKSFYPFYLSEHQNVTCRRLHFVGSCFVLVTLILSIITKQWQFLWLLPFIGYGFAWIGHFVFEKNRPATFQYPLYSLWGDWVMFKDILLGKISIKH